MVRLFRAGSLLATAFFSTAAWSQSTDTPNLLPGESVVRIEAQGVIERMPDFLAIGVAIQSEGLTPKQAADANLAKLAALVDDLRSIGVSEASISAEEMLAVPIHPQVDGREDQSRIVGYRVRQSIGFELLDLSKLQSVVTRLTREGYGDVRARFRLKDEKAARAEAQRAAIANAKLEADNLAGALGKRVGRLLLVGNSQDAYKGWQGFGDEILVSGSRVQPLVLKPAPVEITSKVYSDWSLVDR